MMLGDAAVTLQTPHQGIGSKPQDAVHLQTAPPVRPTVISVMRQEARRLRDELRHLRVSRLVVAQKEPEKQDA